MRLPAPLLRRNPRQHKYDFGHALILAGSARMLGAAALTCQAAMRSGAGVVTLGIPHSLNLAAQKKISPVVLTLPLAETRTQTLSLNAYPTIEKNLSRYDVLALGPGLSRDPSTQKLIMKIIRHSKIPLVIDADALHALARDISVLRQNPCLKILTPHTGEMQRLIAKPIPGHTAMRARIAQAFAKTYHCILLLKGHPALAACPGKKTYINTTGNVGMATAGSGDVLTGMLAAFLAQKISPWDAVKLAACIHGRAGDLAAKRLGKVSLLATDILEQIPSAINFYINHDHP